jgi:hypothetical protein
MQLDLSGNVISQKTDSALSTKLLQELKGGDGSFLILSNEEEGFIQACRNSDGSFVLEYKDNEQYECADKMLNLQKVTMAFLSYFEGAEDYKTKLIWQPLHTNSNNEKKSVAPVMLIILAVVATAIATVIISR